MTTLTHLNPADLLVDTNIRTDLRLDPDFCASIRDRGVLTPIVAITTDHGTRVLTGHRRTAAALKAGHTTIPVILVDTPDDADRIINQLAENDHRTAITTTERINAVHQLALLGISANQIAKRTRIHRDTIDAAITLATRDDTTTLLNHAHDSIAVAAWLAEFDGDDHAQKAITRALHWKGEGEARHETQRQRDKRTHRDRLAAACETIATEYNATTSDTHPAYNSAAATLDTLGLDEADHTTCPGHHLVITEAYIPAECDHTDHDDDEDCYDDDAADPIYATIDGTPYTAAAYCTDWQSNGHTHPHRHTTTPTHTDDNDDTRAAATAERRRVIAGNKAWTASTTVRDEFITSLTGRKTALPGAAVFALESLHDTRDLITRYGERPTTDGMTPAQATNALALWILRSRQHDTTGEAGKNLWRTPRAATSRFLRYLETLGYTLTTVEEAAAGGDPYTVPTTD